MRLNIFFLILFSFFGQSLNAQYFGRNKPRYRNFDFKVMESQNFRIHHYLRNDDMVKWLTNVSEQWYDNHKEIFRNDILQKNPIIFYNNHAEFQQTNTISSTIGIGTGGVTEALKNRVVMPLGFSLQSTHHVLVHELVHAFQFNNISSNDSTSFENLSNTPLWLIEGMAEYFSIGKYDPFTAMWMRDAIINDNLPEISKMNNFKYFPYRYGHSLMAFLGGYFGDNRLNDLFISTAKYGIELGFIEALGVESKNVSAGWHQALKLQYRDVLDGKEEKPQGDKLLTGNTGKMNLSPSMSPNGKYVVFMSEKDVFSLDLFLADAESGNIIRKLTTLGRSNDLDYVNGLESAGAWSPNNKEFAYIGVRKGKNVLVIADIDKPRKTKIIDIKNLDAFVNPVYHPDGKEVVVTGLKNGQVDLFAINLRTERSTQLTNDMYSEILPAFSSDGAKLAFSYDKNSVDFGRNHGAFTFDIAEMDYPMGYVKIYDIFKGANNLNPVYDHQDNIYFVSDRDGMRNLYKLDKGDGRVYQQTDLLTGISGISGLSPMISASTKKDKVVYTHYFNSSYTLYEGSSTSFLNKWIENTTIGDNKPGFLPILGRNVIDIVDNNFKTADTDLKSVNAPITNSKYKPAFKLDYIGGGMGGAGVNNNSFTNAIGLQGGVDMLFSDLLGNSQVYSQLAVNGEILDMGGIVSYINRKNRVAWGVGLSHIPLRTGFRNFNAINLDINGTLVPTLNEQTNLIRIFDQTLSLFIHYPFSTTLRLESGIAGTARSFRWDEYNNYYVDNGFGGLQQIIPDRNQFPPRRRVETGDELQIDRFYTIRNGFGANANVALVGDASVFGLTAPLAGHRFRFSFERFIGNDVYSAVLADGRKYWRAKPFTFAVRSTSYLRWEQKTNSVYPLFLGNMGFVRGLGSAFSNNLAGDVERVGLTLNQVLGSKMSLAGAEIRLPFTGPKGLAIIPTSFLLTDLNFFIDSGVTFNDFNDFANGREMEVLLRDDEDNLVFDSQGRAIYTLDTVKPALLTTVGVSMRINLFGAFILEPYYAKALTQGSSFNFGFNIIPGW